MTQQPEHIRQAMAAHALAQKKKRAGNQAPIPLRAKLLLAAVVLASVIAYQVEQNRQAAEVEEKVMRQGCHFEATQGGGQELPSSCEKYLPQEDTPP